MAEVSDREQALEREIVKLKRVNAALIERVEAGNLPRSAPYAAFEHAALLAEQVRERTQALNQAMHELRASNRLLAEARERAETAGQHLADAIESITDAFVLFDADQRILRFNSRFAEFWRPAGIRIRHGMRLEDLRHLALSSGLVLTILLSLKEEDSRVVAFPVPASLPVALGECTAGLTQAPQA
jgi:two-component system, sensor histidine kinase